MKRLLVLLLASVLSYCAAADNPVQTDSDSAALQAPTLSFSGVVRDASDAGISGVRFTLFVEGEPSKQWETQSSASGRFTMEAIPCGESVLMVESEGTCRTFIRKTFAEGTTPFELDPITVRKGLYVSGQVKENGTGTPIAGANVWAFRMDNSDSDDILELLPLHTVADASGCYEMTTLVAGERYALIADATGYAEQRKTDIIPGTRSIDFLLFKGASVAGTVTQANKPVSDVSMTLVYHGRQDESPEDWLPTESMRNVPLRLLAHLGLSESKPGSHTRYFTTDSAGVFRFYGLRAGKYSIHARQDNKVGLLVARDSVFELGIAQQMNNLRVQLVDGGVVSGTVTDQETHNPISSATVALNLMEALRFETIQTDASGEYRFAGLEAGEATLAVQSPGYLREEKTITVTLGSTITSDMSLAKAQFIAGKVVNSASAPVEGARVELTDLKRDGRARTALKAQRTLSDAQGIFRFDELDRGVAQIRAATGDFMTTTVADVKTGSDDVIIALKPGGTLAGYVHLDSGEIVSGASVELTPQTALGDWAKKRNLKATTGEDGSYQLDGLEPGTYDAAASTSELFSEIQKEVEITAGQETRLDLVLKKGVNVSGRVVAETQDEDQPVSNAQLKCSLSLYGKTRSATTTDLGDFILEHIPSGLATIEMTAPPRYIPKKATQRLVVGDEDVSGVEFRVLLGGRVSGVVTGPEGSGISDARVAIRKTGIFNVGFSHPEAISDATGFYLIDGLEEGKDYTLNPSAEGYAPSKSEPFSLQKGEEITDFDLVLSLGGSISGKVTDASGQPLEGISILAGTTLLDLEGRRGAPTRTDELGTYRIQHVPEGQATVVCEPPREIVSRGDFSQMMQMMKTVLVRDGQETTDVDFQIKIKAEQPIAEEPSEKEPDTKEKNSYIRGVVVNSAGKPVPNVSIQVTPATFRRGFEGNFGNHKSDQQGRINIEKIDPGRYLLNISATARYGAMTVTADAPEENLTITLKGFGAISGRVILKTDGRPVTRFSLACEPQTQNPMDASRWLQAGKGVDYYSPRGDFLIENLAVDRYDLTVRAQGYADGVQNNVVVEEGKTTTDVVIEIGLGGSITGIVLTSLDENPVSVAKVALERAGTNPGLALLGITDSDERAVYTDSGGYFELGNLNPGDVTLIATHPEFAPARARNLRVVDGEESASILITLNAGGTVEGYVYGEDGKGIPGQLVTVMIMERGISQKAVTDENGFYKVRALEPGSYSVMLGDFTQMFISRPGVSTKTAVVKEGEVTVISFGAQGAMIYGLVTRRGEPVGQAKVSVRMSEMPFGFDFNANATTDERGYYQVQGLDKGHYFVMLSEGMLGLQALVKEQIDIPESAGAYEVNLAYPESVVAGIVISATNQSPVPNASVSLVPEEGGYAEQMAQMFGGFSDTTDADGRFEVEQVPANQYKLIAKAQGFGQETLNVEVTRDASIRDIEIQLGGYGILQGQISDAGTGNPVLALVQVKDAKGTIVASNLDSIHAMTQNQGNYKVDGISPGVYDIVAFEGQSQQYIPQVVRGVQIQAKQTTKLDFKLERGAVVLAISFVEPDGTLVAGATAQLLNQAGEDMKDMVFVIGSKLSGVLPKGQYRLFAQAQGYESVDQLLDLSEDSGHYDESIVMRRVGP